MCLEGWSSEIKEAGDHKETWYNKMKEQNYELGVKLAIDEAENVIGMIQYVPIELSLAKGKDLYYILCIWVHGYEEGVGNHQKKGVGNKLGSFGLMYRNFIPCDAYYRHFTRIR